MEVAKSVTLLLPFFQAYSHFMCDLSTFDTSLYGSVRKCKNSDTPWVTIPFKKCNEVYTYSALLINLGHNLEEILRQLHSNDQLQWEFDALLKMEGDIWKFIGPVGCRSRTKVWSSTFWQSGRSGGPQHLFANGPLPWATKPEPYLLPLLVIRAKGQLWCKGEGWTPKFYSGGTPYLLGVSSPLPSGTGLVQCSFAIKNDSGHLLSTNLDMGRLTPLMCPQIHW